MIEFEAKSTGRVLHLRPVPLSRLLAYLNKPEYKEPDVPTYTATAAGGVDVQLPHDETTLDTDDDRRAWAAYTQEREIVAMRRQLAQQRFLLCNGVSDEPDPVESWSFDWEMWGIEPPDAGDRVGFKETWILEEVCPMPEDKAALLLELYRLSGLREDTIKEIERFFRLALAGSRPGGSRGRSNPASEAQDKS